MDLEAGRDAIGSLLICLIGEIFMKKSQHSLEKILLLKEILEKHHFKGSQKIGRKK